MSSEIDYAQAEEVVSPWNNGGNMNTETDWEDNDFIKYPMISETHLLISWLAKIFGKKKSVTGFIPSKGSYEMTYYIFLRRMCCLTMDVGGE